MTPREQMEQAIGHIEAAFDTNEEFRKSAIAKWDEARQRIEELEAEVKRHEAGLFLRENRERVEELEAEKVAGDFGLQLHKVRELEGELEASQVESKRYKHHWLECVESIKKVETEKKAAIERNDGLQSDNECYEREGTDQYAEILRLKRRNLELERKIDGITTLIDA
jgi:chromosome segregation ATPase